MVFPTIFTMGQPISSSTNSLGDQISTDIKVIHTSYSTDKETVYMWLKNVGTTQISPRMIQNGDVFFGSTGNYQRMEYNNTTVGWDFDIETGSAKWLRGDTVKITIYQDTPLSSDIQYEAKYVAYNSISTSDQFSISE